MRRLDLRGLDLHARYLAGGWDPVVKGAWIGKHPAGVDVPIVERADLQVSMSLFAPPFENLPAEMQFDQNLTVSWNGQEIGSFNLEKGAQTLRFDIRAEVQRVGPNRLELRALHSVPFRARPGAKQKFIAVRVDEIVFDSAGSFNYPTEPDLKDSAAWASRDPKENYSMLFQTQGSVLTYFLRSPEEARLAGSVRFTGPLDDAAPGKNAPVRITIAEDGGLEHVIQEWSLTELYEEAAGQSVAFNADLSDFADKSVALSLSFASAPPGIEGAKSGPELRIMWRNVWITSTTDAGNEGTGPTGQIGHGDTRTDLTGTAASPVDKPERRPNIFIILFDTLRADHTEPYGATNVKTPSMLRLASRGVTFDAAFSNSGWTRPSVVSMLTSMYPPAHRVYLNEYSLPRGIPYLPQILRDNGYRTLGIVNNPNAGADFGFDRGVDEFHELFRVKKKPHRRRNPTPESQADYVWNEYVAQFVGRDSEQPFFIYLHELDPHAPYEPLPPYDSMYIQGANRKIDTEDRALKNLAARVERGETQLASGDLDYIDAQYRGEISFMDAYLGRLLDRIEIEGLDSNTLIVFVSDHGESFMEHGAFVHERGVYDELLRVPFIISMPDLLPQGLHINENVQLVDLVPTLLGLLDIDPPGSAQGQSILPLMIPAKSTMRPKRPLFASWMLSETMRHDSIRLGSWKLIQRSDGMRELYNTEVDFYEQDDVFSSHPILAGSLLRMLDAQRELNEALAGTIEQSKVQLDEIDPEILGDLKALGYIE